VSTNGDSNTCRVVLHIDRISHVGNQCERHLHNSLILSVFHFLSCEGGGNYLHKSESHHASLPSVIGDLEVEDSTTKLFQYDSCCKIRSTLCIGIDIFLTFKSSLQRSVLSRTVRFDVKGDIGICIVAVLNPYIQYISIFN
jgi:hypothetical protein